MGYHLSEEYYRPDMFKCAKCGKKKETRLYQYRLKHAWWTVEQLCDDCYDELESNDIPIKEV